MQNITTARELKEAIWLLEERQAIQGQVLKEQFFIVIDSIKPANLIKSTFKEVIASPGLVSNILNTTIGLTAGYFSNKTLVGSSGNLFKKLLGTILQFGVTTLFVRNPEAIKSFEHSIMRRFFIKNEAHS